MSSAVTYARRGTQVRQLADHSGLYAPGDPAPQPAVRTRRDAPDAIIVPATRPASSIQSLIDLAAELGVELVVLCSRQAYPDQIADRMARRIGSRGVVASVEGCPAPAGRNTSGERFLAVNAGRRSDLSAKRNLGLLLARLRGWRKIVFVDDDIEIESGDVSRIARQLDHHPIVGMRCRAYPDNSVLCHARRLAKMPQEVFVTGAVLGVNVDAPDLGFFPDVYNEDWFFFGEAAAARRIPRPFIAKQAEYDPYATPLRARHEEFGDLLAEGLYGLIESSGSTSFAEVVGVADETFWERFIAVRLDAIDTVHKKLTSHLGGRHCGDDVEAAVRALDAARAAYDEPGAAITRDGCVEFLDGWRRDTDAWQATLPNAVALARSADALELLGVTDTHAVRPALTP